MNVYITKVNGRYIDPLSCDRQQMTADIAHQMGCRELGIFPYYWNEEGNEGLGSRIDGIIAGIDKGDLIICRFPTGNAPKFDQELINHIKTYGGRLAVMAENTDRIVRESGQKELERAVGLFNQAEVLIVPSLAMRQFLIDHGIRKTMKFVVREMQDYVMDTYFYSNPRFLKEVHFTGESFEGLDGWNYDVLLKVYQGAADRKGNVQGMGKMPQGELMSMLAKGGFGLVWYRNEEERAAMAYSTSFELARFLAAGIPVIVPTGISDQELIKKNHLGIAADSLEEAAAAVESMTEDGYRQYVSDVSRFAQMIRSGFFTKKCLLETAQAVCRKDAGALYAPSKISYSLGNEFTYAVLRESYGGNLALSWDYKGKPDGFFIFDAEGNLIEETRNIHQHYALIKGYGKEHGFLVKAYVETLRGRLVIAESELTYLKEKKEMENPMVSLVMPACNDEAYVARGLDTALAQSFPALEIIVVDDGSQDRTPEIVDWYAENYPNVTAIHQKNQGAGAARNTGIGRAGSPYIGFMDCDDMMKVRMIEKLYHTITKNECDIAITSAQYMSNDGYSKIGEWSVPEDTGVSMEQFWECYMVNGYPVVWNKLYRAALVKAHPFGRMKAEDSAWTPCILSYAERICYINEHLYEYNRMIPSRFAGVSRTEEEQYIERRNIILFFLQNGNLQKKNLLKRLALAYVRYFLGTSSYHGYRELREEAERM